MDNSSEAIRAGVFSRPPKTLADRIRWVVEVFLDTSQVAFARELGVKPQQLSRWMNDPDRPPSRESIRRISECAGVSEAWIAYGEGSPIRFPGGGPDSDGGPLIQYLSRTEGLREVLSQIAPEAILRAAYKVALEEGWSKERMQELDRIRDEILTGES